MPVGATLAAAREAHGLTVEQVSARTRIRATLIRGIEGDDFGPCGGAVYARGHIRSICGVLGIDAAPLITEFDRTQGGPPAGGLQLAALDREPVVGTEVRRANWPVAMAVTALLVVIVAAAATLFSGPGRHPTPTAAASGAPSTAPSSAAPVPIASVPPSAVAEVSGVTVLLRITGDKSWVSVKNAVGATLFEGLLTHGVAEQFHDAKLLTFVIGNAPAVDLVVNGHEIGAPRALYGVVAKPTYGPGDPSAQAG
ncbi:MAG TPA: RodZ domain-containing protein [Mycobacteriales bacterium]|nr:RodZ domain-containing protein [Mycobacteriales bacterium]